MCRSCLFLILINRLELDSVIVATVLIYILRIDDCICSGLCDLGVIFEDRECSSREYSCVCIFIFSTIPLLNYPVIEHFAGRCSRSSTRGNGRIVLIQCGISRSRAAIGVVKHSDTVSTNRHRAPLSVKVEFFLDPETVSAVISYRVRVPRTAVVSVSGNIAPFVHMVCHVSGLVIGCRYRGLVQYGVGREDLCTSLICVPAVEFISCTNTIRYRDLTAVSYTEVHFLRFRTPVKCWVCSGIRMQEYTVLDLTPLGIYGQAAFRHCRESIWMRACIVYKPAFEHIACRSRRFVVVCAALVV